MKHWGCRAVTPVMMRYLSDSTVQAVHLAVPNVMHYDFAYQALLAGKHVMCEKPLAMNAVEADALVALASEKNYMLEYVTIFGSIR